MSKTGKVVMIRSFKDRDTESIFNQQPVRRWRGIEKVALRKLMMIAAAVRPEVLREPPGNHFEALHGDREGQYSIRINDRSKQLTLSTLAVCIVTLLIGFTGIALLFSMPVMPISFLAWMAGLMVVYTVLAQIMKVVYIRINKEWV